MNANCGPAGQGPPAPTAQGHPLRWQGGLSGKKSDTFAKEMLYPSSASQKSVKQVRGCTIVLPKKFRTWHPAPSWANLSAN